MTNMRMKALGAGMLGGLVLVGSLGIAPSRAHALFGVGDIVLDPTNLVQNVISAVEASGSNTKEYVLDTLAWQVANLAIESMTKSLVNWINSGFEGSPAFVTDLNQNLRGVGDAVAAQFFDELSQQTIATTPFQDQVLDSVRLAYYLRTSPESFYTRYPYTLNQVSPDSRAFLNGDFSQGGWNAWFETVVNPQNNPFGAQMLANEALEGVVANATGNRLQELSWNRGFLSWRGECEQVAENADAIELSGADPCLSYEVQTPGSVIMEQLNTQLGAGVNRLVSADEFNEIIGALLNQLVLQVVGGGDGGGLRGTSQPSSGGGGSYFDRTGGNTGGSTTIAATFATTVARQKQQIETYRANWERIRSAAEAARNRCGTDATPNPQEALDRAAAALVKAADALAALEAIEADIAAAQATGGDQSGNLVQIAEAYTALTTSGVLPTPEQIAGAQSESTDTGDVEPGSLYSQMTRLASSFSCRSSED